MRMNATKVDAKRGRGRDCPLPGLLVSREWGGAEELERVGTSARFHISSVWRPASWRWLWLAAVCLTPTVLTALDPDLPPGSNFDLSHWKLTLPDTNATVISAADLSAGFTNKYFHTGADGSMLFLVPVTGGTTSGSDFPRSELREVLDPLDNRVDWPPYGRHVLTAQCRVLQVPSSKRVVIGQIHSYLGDAPPMMKLAFNSGQVEALVRLNASSSVDTHFPLTSVGLSNVINYQIILTDGLLEVTVNGATQSVNMLEADPAWKYQIYYFKAGAYCQDNDGTTSEKA